MWFSLYSRPTPVLPDSLDSPIHQVSFILDSYGAGELLIYDNQGQLVDKHWSPEPLSARSLAAERYGVPLDMWVNSFEIHPLETKPHRHKAQLRHLARCMAQSCRPVSVIDYALRMDYAPKAMLQTFNSIRDELRAQIPAEARHAYAYPYIEEAALMCVSPFALTTLYRALTFTNEAEARAAIENLVRRVG
jgi:hypothetical protein